MKQRRVGPSGSLGAKLVLIGESPGKVEVQRGAPFVGPSGRMLADWWTAVGLKRSDFYICNVYEYMPPKGNIGNADKTEIEGWAERLHSQLAQLTEPWLLVPTGNIALRACLRKPLWSPTSPKITDQRGSILKYHFADGSWAKLIPTIHPAAALRDASLIQICRADWARIAIEAKTPARLLPARTCAVPPVPAAVIEQYLSQASYPDTVMAIDIETNPAAGKILCVGFAWHPGHAMTLPWPEGRAVIQQLCQSPCTKVGQNFSYDRYWLWRNGIAIHGEIYDTLMMNHCRNSTLPHSLAMQTSLFTREPFYKRDAKDEDIMRAMNLEAIDALYRYCGLDACVTRELYQVHTQALAGET